MSELPDFSKLRHNEAHHLGLGDVRITIAQQNAIDQRIAELEEQLMSAQNDGFDTAKDEFNEKLRSQDKEIERLRSALTVQIRDMKAFKKVLEDDGGFVNAVPAVQKSIDEMQAALEATSDT